MNISWEKIVFFTSFAKIYSNVITSKLEKKVMKCAIVQMNRLDAINRNQIKYTQSLLSFTFKGNVTKTLK